MWWFPAPRSGQNAGDRHWPGSPAQRASSRFNEAPARGHQRSRCARAVHRLGLLREPLHLGSSELCSLYPKTAVCTSVDAGNGIGTGYGPGQLGLCTPPRCWRGRCQSVRFARQCLSPSAHRQLGTYAYDKLRPLVGAATGLPQSRKPPSGGFFVFQPLDQKRWAHPDGQGIGVELDVDILAVDSVLRVLTKVFGKARSTNQRSFKAMFTPICGVRPNLDSALSSVGLAGVPPVEWSGPPCRAL